MNNTVQQLLQTATQRPLGTLVVLIIAISLLKNIIGGLIPDFLDQGLVLGALLIIVAAVATELAVKRLGLSKTFVYAAVAVAAVLVLVSFLPTLLTEETGETASSIKSWWNNTGFVQKSQIVFYVLIACCVIIFLFTSSGPTARRIGAITVGLFMVVGLLSSIIDNDVLGRVGNTLTSNLENWLSGTTRDDTIDRDDFGWVTTGEGVAILIGLALLLAYLFWPAASTKGSPSGTVPAPTRVSRGGRTVTGSFVRFLLSGIVIVLLLDLFVFSDEQRLMLPDIGHVDEAAVDAFQRVTSGDPTPASTEEGRVVDFGKLGPGETTDWQILRWNDSITLELVPTTAPSRAYACALLRRVDGYPHPTEVGRWPMNGMFFLTDLLEEDQTWRQATIRGRFTSPVWQLLKDNNLPVEIAFKWAKSASRNPCGGSERRDGLY